MLLAGHPQWKWVRQHVVGLEVSFIYFFCVFLQAWFVLLFLAFIVQPFIKGLVIAMHSNGPQAKFYHFLLLISRVLTLTLTMIELPSPIYSLLGKEMICL